MAPNAVDTRARRILTLDGSGGLVAGAAVLALRAPIARFYGLTAATVAFVALANLAYGSYASALAWRASRGALHSARAVEALIAANALWTLVCAVLLVSTRDTATVFGQLHLGLEGLYVLGLAVAEARYVRPPLRAPGGPHTAR
jgi:hypothetical protein